MSNKDRILATIALASGPICDDCLSVRAGVRPRQQVFALCTRLASVKAFTRENATCGVCGKTKRSNRPHDTHAAGPRPPIDSGGSGSPSRQPSPVPASPSQASTRTAKVQVQDQGPRPWYWEGHVQEALRRHLVAENWTITAFANTETKEPGIDLVASKDGRWLAVEVKGFPTTVYDHGAKRGQPKPTQPTNQARQWYSHALLSMMRLRHKRTDAEIALCFPDFQTYRALAAQTRRCFELLGFGIYFVAEDGGVRQELQHRPVAL